jgi:hypothetical protein
VCHPGFHFTSLFLRAGRQQIVVTDAPLAERVHCQPMPAGAASLFCAFLHPSSAARSAGSCLGCASASSWWAATWSAAYALLWCMLPSLRLACQRLHAAASTCCTRLLLQKTFKTRTRVLVHCQYGEWQRCSNTGSVAALSLPGSSEVLLRGYKPHDARLEAILNDQSTTTALLWPGEPSCGA